MSSDCLQLCSYAVGSADNRPYLWKKSSMDSMVWSMLLLQMPSLSRKHGSRTTDSRESCLMMVLSLSVFRFWYMSWWRSWRKWVTVGLVGLPGSAPKPGPPLPPMESSMALAKSRQQLQQSRPMGDLQSSSDISEGWRMCSGQVHKWQKGVGWTCRVWSVL